MNKHFFSLTLTFVLGLSGPFSPLYAQYNPPPPPEQQNTGEAPGMDQQGPPPGAPMQEDQGAPPPPQDAYTGGQPGPDQGPSPDQGPPPGQGAPDQGAPDDQGAPPPDGSDAGDANFQTFYDNLSSQGNWVQTDNYGYVWQPNVSDSDWRPYSAGHWVYTDEGWTWVADASEPWGWATYHYGRWANLDGYGWVWVPGYTWAPAWVSWRYGGGYCGWAPLPPDTFVGIDFGGVGLGFHIGGDCDTAYDIGPGYYNFIPVGYIGERDYRRHYIDRNNNFVIINNTRNVTNIVVNNQRAGGRFGRVSVGGPNFSTINAQSNSPVQRAHLARSNRVGAASLSGNQLAVFAPRVRPAAGTTFRPSRVAATVGNARVNSGASINQPLQVNARVRPQAASQAQIAAAQNAHFATAARVATPQTHPTAALNRPLTSYQPHEARHAATGAGSAPSAPANRSFAPSPTNSGTHGNAFTGQGETGVHHASADGVNRAATAEAPATHHATQNAFTPQVQHSASTPQAGEERHHQTEVQHQDVRPQPEVQREEVHVQPQAQHEEVRPQPQAQREEVRPQPQVQHQEPHPPAEHHDAPPPQHANAPASNGGGGHPGGGGDGKKDDKQQH